MHMMDQVMLIMKLQLQLYWEYLYILLGLLVFRLLHQKELQIVQEIPHTQQKQNMMI